MIHNPDRRLSMPGMPIASRLNCYSAIHVTMATPEETDEFLKLKRKYHER